MSKADLFEVFTPAHKWSLTFANIQAEFRKCGIYPYNPLALKLKFCCTSETTVSKWEIVQDQLIYYALL